MSFVALCHNILRPKSSNRGGILRIKARPQCFAPLHSAAPSSEAAITALRGGYADTGAAENQAGGSSFQAFRQCPPSLRQAA